MKASKKSNTPETPEVSAAIMRPIRQRAALRSDLAELADGFAKQARRAEVPTFAGELP